MIKKRCTIFMAAIAILFMSHTVNADFENELKLMASDGTNGDSLGWSISISGDMAIVGAPQDNSATGAAYVFVRNAGVWTQQQKLLADDGVGLDQFGESVSISGDSIIVGAKWDNSYRGAAYVFVRNPATGVWTEQQKLLASDGAAYDIFGKSVAISGDTAVVGADGTTAITFTTGYAYVFVRDPATGVWTEQQKLLASDGEIDDFFGYRVAVDGDTALVGAIGDGSFNGAAYVFVRDPATGVWTEQQKLLTSNASAFDRIGESVSIEGDRAIIGAEGDNSRGSAYIFERDPATDVWTEQQRLWDSTGAASDYFGRSVCISGDTAIVGASDDDDNTLNSGSAFVFVRDPVTGVWTGQKLLASDGSAFHKFGQSVSIDGDTAIVGAKGAPGNEANTGAAYVYTNTVVAAPEITVTDSVAAADDLLVPFGNVTLSTTSTQTVTMTNDGSDDLVLGSIAVVNPLIAPYSLMDDCDGQTLAAGASCTFEVFFSPATADPFNDSFDIPSNDSDEDPVTVGVSGTGTAALVPDINVTDSIVDINDNDMPFPDTTEGTSSATETVTIFNTGTDSLIVSNIQLTGANIVEFSLDVNGGSSPCNSTAPTVASPGSCTVAVTFNPSSQGGYTANLQITSDDPDPADATINVALSGTGLQSVVNNAPNQFNLVSPADRQIDVSVPVTFEWEPATDPDGDPVTYDFYNCTDPDPIAANCSSVEVASLTNSSSEKMYFAGFGTEAGIIMFGVVLAGGLTRRKKTALLLVMLIITCALLVACGSSRNNNNGPAPNNNKSHTVSGLTPLTTYYWTVVAKDDQGGDTQSDTWRYTTE